tara:strand:+ start:177 stop:380 length:204 start_codon:yes stop_codon:yes gene_type:complete
MIPVEGHKNLFRDEKTNAIVNNDIIAYENYVSMRRKNTDKQAELDDMKKEIETLKSMLNELASKITS